LEPLKFGGEYAAAERGQLVVASPLVTQVGRRPMGGFGDEIGIDETLDDAVEVPRVERHESVSAIADLLNETIAVPLFLGEREEELEVHWLEW
jgi:hypothetical protein